MSSFAFALLFWRPGWENAPWYAWVISLGTFAAAVICWLWLFWQLAKRRYLARYEQDARQPVAKKAVNVDSADRSDPNEPDDDDDDSGTEQTVFQMAWKRECGR